MFGFVTADLQQLDKPRRKRYQAVYCGICRQIRLRSSSLARLGLQYDMAFLALLLMSLYEPEELSGSRACGLHPLHPRPWVDNEYIAYCADMNVALAYYKCLDDWQDDGKQSARLLSELFGKSMAPIKEKWPRQCKAIADATEQLSQLEKEGCADADAAANCFGALMEELMIYRQDHWEGSLRQLGHCLGRFIYLADAAVDYRRDQKHHSYNPFLAMGTGEDPQRWEQYLVLAMARCTDSFERLPLVQDKDILDNILYKGVWMRLRKARGGNHA